MFNLDCAGSHIVNDFRDSISLSYLCEKMHSFFVCRILINKLALNRQLEYQLPHLRHRVRCVSKLVKFLEKSL